MTNAFGHQLGLLRRQRSFTALFLATLGSGVGTGVAVIALMVDVFDRTGSGKWVAALLIADFLPMLAIGLALGPLVDRLSRRRLMITADLVRFAAFLVLPFADNALVIVVLAGVTGFATGFFRPAVYAGMPNLVEERDLPQANALFQTIDNGTYMLGPLLGGMLLSVSGPATAYVVNAVTFLLSALLIVRIPERSLQVGVAAAEGHWRALREGFRVVLESRALLTVLVTWTVVMVGNAHVNVAEVSLAKVALDGGNLGLGILMAAAGVGLVAGSFLGGIWVERRGMRRAYSSAILLMALGVGLAAVSPALWLAAAAVVLSGFGNGIASVCNPLLVQRGAPDEVRGRAFTVIMSVNFAALGLGMVLAGVLTDALGSRWVWGIAAATFAVAAAVAAVLARGLSTPPAAEVEPLPVVAVGAPQAVQPVEHAPS